LHVTRHALSWSWKLSLRQGLDLYYSLFGPPGLLLAARARFLAQEIEIGVAAPGVRHPVYLRVRTTDIGMCGEILVKHLYGCEFHSEPRSIVDAGANIGLASIFFANKYPDARIVAIEPEASNFRMLKKNTARYPNVTPVQAALWNENCELELFDPEQGHSAFQMRSGSASATRLSNRVQAKTVDEIMSELNITAIDLLKVDIEGGEKEVFANPAKWIDRVGTIAIELHESLRPGCEQSVDQATRDFDGKWKAGETNYLTKANAARPATAMDQGASSSGARSKFPLKILSVESIPRK
jgi:FkbM family methyltransferase